MSKLRKNAVAVGVALAVSAAGSAMAGIGTSPGTEPGIGTSPSAAETPYYYGYGGCTVSSGAAGGFGWQALVGLGLAVSWLRRRR